MAELIKQQNWLVVGVEENWDTAFAQPLPIWGLKNIRRGEFEQLNTGDIIWCYATSPVKGIIGVCLALEKYIDKKNLVWYEELINNKVIWPLRFRIQPLKLLPNQRWINDKIEINDFGLNLQIGFQLLNDQQVNILIQRSKTVFGFNNLKELLTGPSIIPYDKIPQNGTALEIQEPKQINTHREIQNMIAEIGKLQAYYTQTEYPINLPDEKKNLDVVWKREINGVPTLAFEVELSAQFEKAIIRLKYAYTNWNSRPRIIAPSEYFPKIKNIIATEDRHFINDIKIYHPEQINDLFNKKRENLGIY